MELLFSIAVKRSAITVLILAGCAHSSVGAPTANVTQREAEHAADPATGTPITYRRAVVSVVRGERRMVFIEREEPQRSTQRSQHEAVYEYGAAPPEEVTVLTPEGLCHTRTGRSFRAVQTCEGTTRGWIGYELEGCVVAEAGPLVVFNGAEALRVQSLRELEPLTGGDARDYRERARAHNFVPSQMREAAAMQHEMESMLRVQNGEPPLPPFIGRPTEFGAVRSVFGVWMIDVLTHQGRPLMATSDGPGGNFLLHPGAQWHTLVAGPTDADYVFLIGTHGYSWPLVERVRPGTPGCNESMHPHRCRGPSRGVMGPGICADTE